VNKYLYLCHPLVLSSPTLMMHGHMNLKYASLYYPIIYTRHADKSLARPTCRCILFDGENISFDASLVVYTNSANISPIMIINMIYQNQNLLSL